MLNDKAVSNEKRQVIIEEFEKLKAEEPTAVADWTNTEISFFRESLTIDLPAATDAPNLLNENVPVRISNSFPNICYSRFCRRR